MTKKYYSIVETYQMQQEYKMNFAGTFLTFFVIENWAR